MSLGTLLCLWKLCSVLGNFGMLLKTLLCALKVSYVDGNFAMSLETLLRCGDLWCMVWNLGAWLGTWYGLGNSAM